MNDAKVEIRLDTLKHILDKWDIEYKVTQSKDSFSYNLYIGKDEKGWIEKTELGAI